MDERKKDLAKRFFTLLYLFLTRKYERVELVFIRHTDEAQEVDEGHVLLRYAERGTVVYSALELMQQICAARYPRSEWNICWPRPRMATHSAPIRPERAVSARAPAAAGTLLCLHRMPG
jgi:hypothetical protein